jgi:hypothetical protein
VARVKGTRAGKAGRHRLVYVYTEGEVTEPEYIDAVLGLTGRTGSDRTVDLHIANAAAVGSMRKPQDMVREAVDLLKDKEREAGKAGLTREDPNWPQVWVLFDRDEHVGIPQAFAEAEKAGVRIAYSHPCFEFWRLLHYQNYTSTFGGVCGKAAELLRGQREFATTYVAGAKATVVKGAKAVEGREAKHVKADQLRGRYAQAKKHATQINKRRAGLDPTKWDPYTDVWRFVEDGLGIDDY